MKASVFAPGTIGNVGPGFDVLGLAVEGLGDTVTVELVEGATRIERIEGRDAAALPRDAAVNCAAIAAAAMLRRLGLRHGAAVTLEKGLPLAGGLGGSAASSVGGAMAAWLAAQTLDPRERPAAAPREEPSALIVEAALAGEAAVAGRHLDNIAPCIYGGLTLVRSVDPADVIAVPVEADWWLALVTPAVRVETKAARAILPAAWEQREWVQQMANTAALVFAFSTGDAELARRALEDRYAEPRRASLIPGFFDMKRAALEAGAFGCSISGSGPTVFALAEDERAARAAAAAMKRVAHGGEAATAHVGRVARRGARATERP